MAFTKEVTVDKSQEQYWSTAIPQGEVSCSYSPSNLRHGFRSSLMIVWAGLVMWWWLSMAHRASATSAGSLQRGKCRDEPTKCWYSLALWCRYPVLSCHDFSIFSPCMSWYDAVCHFKLCYFTFNLLYILHTCTCYTFYAAMQYNAVLLSYLKLFHVIMLLISMSCCFMLLSCCGTTCYALLCCDPMSCYVMLLCHVILCCVGM